jgi:hypothetical protein
MGLGYCFLIELENHHSFGSVAILASDRVLAFPLLVRVALLVSIHNIAFT